MSEIKAKNTELRGRIKISGVDGLVLPFVYQGKLVRATASSPQIVLWEQLPYDSKIHIGRALESGHIEIEKEE